MQNENEISKLKLYNWGKTRLIHSRFHDSTDTSAYISIYMNIKVFYNSSLTLSSVVLSHFVQDLKCGNTSYPLCVGTTDSPLLLCLPPWTGRCEQSTCPTGRCVRSHCRWPQTHCSVRRSSPPSLWGRTWVSVSAKHLPPLQYTHQRVDTKRILSLKPVTTNQFPFGCDEISNWLRNASGKRLLNRWQQRPQKWLAFSH